ncbi:SDR family NAD(P)-dependent oxidoreductase [Pelagibacterium montanilacus]|uniref:SDR family NAD(P)-dependent oxidoreductase n=1 Tax=Pelagibacterium montanilacus TaxID=2185280 RepID=UPI000F8D40D1|nr:SDR family oxidoreductase [Pelagibacterium montanilacus]
MALSLDLSGRAIAVTGASGGIGAAIARRLAEAGARVVVHYHANGQAADAVAGECPGAVAIGADLGSQAGCEEFFAEALAAMGTLDGLVNCAGPQTLVPFAETRAADFSEMLAAHVTAPATLIRLLAGHGAGREGGSVVVNIASIEAMRPAPAHAHYASAKAGLVMLTRAAALEFAGIGLRVNAVAPGLIGRPGIKEQWPEGVERWVRTAPLGRLGAPGDVADATAFLCSDLAGWITGEILVVDGGMSAAQGW